MSDLDPASDGTYVPSEAVEAEQIAQAKRHRRVRDRLLLWWLRLEYWLGIR